ncbi:response regulator transcription factor [Salinisphaera aquimarina]|uniref:Response regulator transcription factor n=1 Tax=Salinisphaera aquimarina TaxID=2094031 RepID=A0ABV7EUT3_9GAMM
MHVLIIEDNDTLATNIGEYLEQQGDEPDFASDGSVGLRLCEAHHYDAVVLDLHLPKIDGIALCRRLREEIHKTTPVLMLTARDTVDDRIQGFEAGADDYLTKPFSLRELYLRLQAIVRRRADALNQLRAADLCMDIDQRLVHCNSARLELAPISFQILELLMRAHPGVVTRAEIEHVIWNDEPPESEAALRGHIHRLRHLLGVPGGRSVIRTVHGVGYQLTANPV